ncbi:MAG: aminotransferase class V-fold PLP-dependent enzyme [Pyrinomonadaceae bacterium]
MDKISRRKVLVGMLGTTAAYSLSATSTAGTPANLVITDIHQPEYMFAPGLIYLNTGSLGPTPRSVMDATIKAWHELETNPVGMSYDTGPVHAATDRVREQLARFIGCAADELLITRSTTDAMNKAALGIDLTRGDRVLTTDVEHEGGSVCWKYLKRRRGIEIDLVTIAPTDHDTNTILRRFEKAVTKRTKAISVSHVITSTGLRMPIAEIAALAKSRGILCIVDGAQAVGGIDVNVRSLGCDAYAAPGHKWLMAPKGTGFLYISKDAASKIQPVEREDGLRFVSHSTGIGCLPLVVGLGVAVESMRARGISKVEMRNIELRNRAYAGLLKVPKVQIVSPPPGPLATALVAFKLPDAVDSTDFRRKVLFEKYNLVLKTAEKRWFNGLRISPHVFNTEADIDAAIKAIRWELA